MTKCKQKTKQLKTAEIARIAQKMAHIAFEELNLNENGTMKFDDNEELCKLGTVTGLAFKTGLLAIAKKTTNMQLNIYKVLLKGFPGVTNVNLDYPKLTFSYCPSQVNDSKIGTHSQTEAIRQSTLQVQIEDLIHRLKPTDADEVSRQSEYAIKIKLDKPLPVCDFNDVIEPT